MVRNYGRTRSGGYVIKRGKYANYMRRKYFRKGINRSRNPRGYLKIIRKLPEMAIVSSGLGTVNLVDPTTTCMQVNVLGLTTGAPTTLYDVAFSMRFRLDQVLQSGDITSLADKYKIKSAYVRVFYNNTGSSTAVAPALAQVGGMPTLQFITDHDDAILPGTLDRLRERMGVKYKTFKNVSSFIGIKCNPRCTREVFATGTVSGYEQVSKPIWLDSASDDVEHYGIKGVITGIPLVDPNDLLSLLKFDVALTIEAADFQ